MPFKNRKNQYGLVARLRSGAANQDYITARHTRHFGRVFARYAELQDHGERCAFGAPNTNESLYVQLVALDVNNNTVPVPVVEYNETLLQQLSTEQPTWPAQSFPRFAFLV